MKSNSDIDVYELFTTIEDNEDVEIPELKKVLLGEDVHLEDFEYEDGNMLCSDGVQNDQETTARQGTPIRCSDDPLQKESARYRESMAAQNISTTIH